MSSNQPMGRVGFTKRIPRLVRRQGQALILLVLALPVLVGSVSAALTVGSLYFAQTRLQNAVDAAALAGAQVAAAGYPSNVGQQAALISKDAPGASGTVAVQSTPPDTVAASGMLTLPGGFAAVLGFKSFSVRARAVATWGAGAPFNFAVFQGDPNPSDPPLTLNGNNQIVGSVHSNNDLVINGHVVVSGSCEGDPEVTANGSARCEAGDEPHAPEVPMPDWQPAQVTPESATTVGSPSEHESFDPQGPVVTGNYIIYGNVTFSGNESIDGHYVVYGNATFNGNNSFSGSLTVYGGNITLNGSLTQYMADQGVALAAFADNKESGSETANITVNGNQTIDGALYSPDGQIVLNGNVTVTGAVVGRQDVLNGNVSVTYNANDVNAVPVSQVALIR